LAAATLHGLYESSDLVVLGRVHADEVGAFQVLRLVLDSDAAAFGRIGLMIDLDLHDVFVF
jgi:hypothetical protein